METDFIGAAQREVDVEFKSNMAQKMLVPRHIRLGDSDNKSTNFECAEDKKGAAEKMSVPQRISATGSDETSHAPAEILFEDRTLSQLRQAPFTLRTPPSKLTVSNGIYRTAADELEVRVSEQRTKEANRTKLCDGGGDPSDDNNLNTSLARSGTLSLEQRVLLLDKQVTRLNTRLYQMEDEVESVNYWQKILMCLSIGLVVVSALKSMLKR